MVADAIPAQPETQPKLDELKRSGLGGQKNVYFFFLFMTLVGNFVYLLWKYGFF